MAKTGERRLRRGADALKRGRRARGPARRSAKPVHLTVRDERPLLDRILDTPHLAYAVPRLQPEVLHRVIQRCGLEDCAELVALATPDQLMRVFDVDLWRSARPGLDERLDVDRFGVWLEVLMEAGAEVAAQKLIGLDLDLVVAALAQHLVVVDRAAAASFTTLDGEEVGPFRRRADGIACEVGAYLIESKRTDAWDTIVALLLLLDAEHHDYFDRVMRGCRNLSNSGFEVDGLDGLLTEREQQLFDLGIDRERRREQQGYLPPPQAQAFLQMSRHLQLEHAATPPPNPIAGAYFRAVDWTPPTREADENREAGRLPAASSAAPPDPVEGAEAAAAIVDLLVDAGVLPQQPRALLGAADTRAPRLARMEMHLLAVRERDEAIYSRRTEELAYLANAIAAGCSIQARPFTVVEASDAVAAICNLGLENWPPHWLADNPRRHSSASATTLPDAFLVDHDLVAVFQVGWTVLYQQVCMYAATRLIGVLEELRGSDDDSEDGLRSLRSELTKHSRAGVPWRARDALDVIMILDTPAWATLLGLIDECPVMHAALDTAPNSGTRSVSPSAFAFISENSQIATVHAFMESLADTLRG